MPNAAILFEPDGYLTGGDRLMGRQSAGAGFLRAAVAASQGQTIWGYTPNLQSAEVFQRLVREIDASAEPKWLAAHRLDLLEQIGTLYLPVPGLANPARLRLRAGASAYSLVGVTHTTSSHEAMDAITDLLSAPVMPWDALICTSAAVAGTVAVLIEAQFAYLRWRFGRQLSFVLPQFPIIPLGVHTADFAFSEEARSKARAALGIAADETVALFVGRLSFHAKAHPHAMYVGLEQAARATGSKIVLLQCGWFGNEAIEKAFKDGQARWSASVRAIWSDGRDPQARRQAWAAGDFFVSLSDSVQETFGLTPIEAMAAGLPCIVSDWDGYKDTVRDGIDGFRIATLMPPAGLGAAYATGYEAGSSSYDMFCAQTSRGIAADIGALGRRLGEVVGSPELRRKLGEAGRQRARESFDWRVIFRRYQQLWDDLTERRAKARADEAVTAHLRAAPREYPSRADPFRAFGHYATAHVTAQSLLALAPGASHASYQALRNDPVFNLGEPFEPDDVRQIVQLLEQGPLQIKAIADATNIAMGHVIMAASVLAKMGLVSIGEVSAQ
jgi:starch synthase